MNQDNTCQLPECSIPVIMGTRGRSRKYCGDDHRIEMLTRLRRERAKIEREKCQEGHKKCGRCGEEKLFSSFSKDKRRYDGMFAYCKDCVRSYHGHEQRKRAELSKLEYNKQRYHRMKRELGEEHLYTVYRDNYLKRTYGLSLSDYENLLESQGGACSICRAPFDQSRVANRGGGKKAYAVDHDHSCCPGKVSCGGCVRGILCHGCNAGLGHFEDNPERLRDAIRYLAREPTAVQPALILPEAA